MSASADSMTDQTNTMVMTTMETLSYRWQLGDVQDSRLLSTPDFAPSRTTLAATVIASVKGLHVRYQSLTRLCLVKDQQPDQRDNDGSVKTLTGLSCCTGQEDPHKAPRANMPLTATFRDNVIWSLHTCVPSRLAMRSHAVRMWLEISYHGYWHYNDEEIQQEIGKGESVLVIKAKTDLVTNGHIPPRIDMCTAGK